MTQEKAPFERHVQTVIQVIVIAIVAWVGKTTQDSSIEIARLSERIEGMKSNIKTLSNKVNDRYTSDDAVKDMQIIDRRFQGFGERFERIERRLEKLEGQE